MQYITKWRLSAHSRKAKGKKGRRLFLALALLFLGWSALSEWGLSSISEELTQEAARGYLLSSINQAVDEELENRAGSFVSVAKAGDGKVSAISADAASLNQMKFSVLEKLRKSLNGKVSAYVPIGSLTGLGVLNGRGPGVPVKLKLEGSADVTFRTEFVSAGVNQSCHRITMTVTARAFSQSKRFAVETSGETTAVLAETVVVGQVPEVALTAGN